MLYVMIARDKEGAFEVRKANREAHLAFLKSLGDRLKIGGPFLDTQADIMNGSLLVVEADSQADAEAMLANDPYAKAGLFAAVDVRPWKWTVNAPAA